MNCFRSPLSLRIAVGLLLLGLLPLLGGCSAFDSRWRKTTQDATPRDALQGAWQGTWTSHKTGHTGRLRALVERVSKDSYLIAYQAVYGGALKFEYETRVQVSELGPAHVRFTGTADLGEMAGGVYQYDGTADSRQFQSTYESKGDHGVFEMTRPGGPPVW